MFNSKWFKKISTNIMTSETPDPVYSKYPKSKFDEMGELINAKFMAPDPLSWEFRMDLVKTYYNPRY